MDLRTKLIAVIIGVILFSGIVSVFLVKDTMSGTIHNEFQIRGTSLSRNLAAQSDDLILTDDIVELHNLIEYVKENEPSVVYIFITNPEGKVLTHTFKEGFPVDLLEVNTLEQDQKENIAVLDTEEGNIHDFAYAISQGETGTMRVGISDASLQQNINDTVLRTILAIFIVLVLGIFIASVIANMTIEPITKLRDAACEIGKGNMDLQINCKSNDEIGQLGISFKKMVEELQKTTVSKNYMDSIVRNLFDMLFVIKLEGTIQIVNMAACDLLGYGEEELVGQPFNSVFADENLQYKDQFLKDIIEKGSFKNVETSFITRDGRKILVSFSASVMRDKQGDIQGIICVARDVSERKRMELMYRNIFDNAGDAILTIDSDHRITSWNKSAENIFGWKEEEVIEKDLFQLIAPPMLLEENRQIAIETLEGRPVSGLENVFLSNDGSMKYITLTTSSLKDTGNNVIGVLCVIRDVTEIKRTEELNLDYSRLILANKAKSEFLANMSHELRTPLNAIIGFSELLKRKLSGDLNEKHVHYIDNVLTSSKHLLSLIDDVLDLSKVEAGKIELDIEEVSVHDYIDETLGLMKEKATKRNISLKKELDPQLNIIDADPKRFKQVLLNLLDNAVKFSKEEGGVVTVSATKEGDMAKISISDTGQGIKEEDLGKLFTRFGQLEAGSTRKHGGTGLGLAISKQLVELHGGKIMANSKLGEGSTFTFLLPIKFKTEDEK